jgi:hypothetical protein
MRRSNCRIKYSLVSLVVRLVRESKIEWSISRLVTQSHKILMLAGTFVSCAVLVTA